MKFAYLNGSKTEATKGAQGFCPVCFAPVIAKCGIHRIHHWAHKSNNSCDPWWENETAWHRNWKNLFPEQWQEKVFVNAQTGERHIADVVTPHTPYNLVIEFQHSHISSEERQSREAFYTQENRRMMWVVDGSRLKNDYKRFLNNFNCCNKLGKGIFRIIEPTKIFNNAWCSSSVPVIFDFGEEFVQKEKIENILFCLLPQKFQNNSSVFIGLSRKEFVNFVTDGTILNRIYSLLNPTPLKFFITPSMQLYRYQHARKRRF